MSIVSDCGTELTLQKVLDENRLIDDRIAQLIQESNKALKRNDVMSKLENDTTISLLFQRKQNNQLLLDALCEHSWGEPYYEQRVCEHCEAIKQ
jgi:hypothetical protein